MEISLGLGLTLACTTAPEPDRLIERLDQDPALRRTVDTILADAILHRHEETTSMITSPQISDLIAR
jgi:hypothetical protein